MLSHEHQSIRDEHRRALQAYLAAPGERPLVLERHDCFSFKTVLFPTLYSRIRFTVRYVVLCLARWTQSCRLQAVMYRLLGVKVGRDVWISPGVVLDPLFPELIELNDDCLLGIGCRLFTHEFTATQFRVGRVRVGKGSVIGGYATVRGGVTIGERATVAACSLVTRNVRARETVIGVPARPFKLLREREG